MSPRRAGKTKGKTKAALARASSPVKVRRAAVSETLEGAYEAWSAQKLMHAAAVLRRAEERKRLEGQGSFLVGAVRAAGGELERSQPAPKDASLATAGSLERFLRDAEAQLARARADLDDRVSQEAAQFEQALVEAKAAVRAVVERYLSRVRPQLTLFARPAGPGRQILHIARVSPDEAVLLFYLLSGSLPSRYGFLFDDSTEDASLAPPPLYPDEGVTPSECRPGASALRRRVEGKAPVLPAKGFVPVLVPTPEGQAFYRLLQRGPVMEVELEEGDAFRSLLTPAEAERFAGHLLRLKLEGRIDLELEAG